MGVYIKGMEMPINPDMAPTAVWVYPNGYAVVFKDNGKMQQYTQAVPFPPHGRLIDADALMKEFEKAQRVMEQHGQEYSCSFLSSSQEISTEWYCVEDMVENAPTIIPASEEGEHDKSFR